jgi:dihydrofolate synthase/folylpolyglutamate synthase
MTFQEALKLLERRQEAKWKLGLSRIEGLLSALGDPQDAIPAVHAAGTNGKGSFCAVLASILSAAGYKTGLFTSPHLVTPRERIRVDGKPISEEDFGREVGEAAAAEPEEATYFELITAAAFLHFRRVRADFSVVEVGMGGRLDATNAIKTPALSVITSIAHDHGRHLGSTLSEIAGEKCGILKEGVVCVSGEHAYEPLKTIRRRAYEAAAPLIVHRGELTPIETDWENGVQTVRGEDGDRFEFGMLGAPARRNASLALRAVEELRAQGVSIPDEAVARGLREARWSARFEVRREEGGRFLVVDGAHNPAAMEAFCADWERSPFARMEASFLVSILADKDVDAVLRILAPRVRRAICCAPATHRALPAADLARRLRGLGVPEATVVEDPLEAVEAWRAAGTRVGAVVGSFYSAGRVLSAMREAASA